VNKNLNALTSLISVAALIFLSIACNQSSGTDAPAANAPAANTAPAASTTSTTTLKDVSGSYAVNGQNEGGAGNYTGDLTVTKRDQVYQFTWKSGDKTYDGVGVQGGNSVAVAFTEGTDGKGCGVVLYQIRPDGTLEGKAGYWGVNQAESETATRTSGTGLEGSYDLKGTNTQGGNYTGKLSVKREGAGYRFQWAAPSSITGFGIQGADMVAVGIGGKQCGFVGYDIQPDGTLSGKWGSPGSTAVGTEVAKKK
jgi:hypothetical protein